MVAVPDTTSIATPVSKNETSLTERSVSIDTCRRIRKRACINGQITMVDNSTEFRWMTWSRSQHRVSGRSNIEANVNVGNGD